MRSDPPPNAQHYRDLARRIRRDAERATSDEVRRQLLNIAAQYETLAENLERQSG
jgi:hypothetical protein